MLKNYQNGLKGESIALSNFLKLGFTKLFTRYKTPLGEIDLICVNNNLKLLLFVEVKYRSKIDDYIDIISQKQILRIQEAINIFMATNDSLYKNYSIRIDGFFIDQYRNETHHIENII